MSAKITHGDTTKAAGRATRLYGCWRGMISRAKSRENCKVYEGWVGDYLAFKVWAMSNGYKENLVLCRTADIGDYHPDNVRWDTSGNNSAEALSKHYKFMHKDKLVKVYNLREYCREHKLNDSNMCGVHNGRRKSHKGYTKYTNYE